MALNSIEGILCVNVTLHYTMSIDVLGIGNSGSKNFDKLIIHNIRLATAVFFCIVALILSSGQSLYLISYSVLAVIGIPVVVIPSRITRMVEELSALKYFRNRFLSDCSSIFGSQKRVVLRSGL
jgi:hypothetical protein